MSGAKWICFCGSEKIISLKIVKNPRRVYAFCITCHYHLVFNKWGMRKITDKEWSKINNGVK